MSRVRKFRAWHEGNQQMVYFDLEKLKRDQFQAGHLIALLNGDYGDMLMDYVGLQDSKGVDVYEGDLVNLHEYGEVYKEVLFHNGCFCVHGFNFNPAKCTVIGNIHENPELLEVSDE